MITIAESASYELTLMGSQVLLQENDTQPEDDVKQYAQKASARSTHETPFVADLVVRLDRRVVFVGVNWDTANWRISTSESSALAVRERADIVIAPVRVRVVPFKLCDDILCS